MGEVYRARDPRLGRDVAIKILPVAFCADEERVRRFEHEIRAVAALQHPHICALYDVGHEADIHFFVMEFVAGDTLRDLLSKNGRLSPRHVIGYSIEIADALAEAHRAHLVHRDLKPANIIVSRSGAKVLDFGLAKVQSVVTSGDSATHGQLTTLGQVVGTLHYMSPEQLQGRAVDCRSDVFALGAVIYEMATGRSAFAGTSQASVIAAILEREPVDITSLQQDIPEVLWQVVRKCLAKRPADRWQSAEDVAQQLRIIARMPNPHEPIQRRKTARTGSRHTRRIRSIAVLPLEDFSGGTGEQFFSDGITEALTVALSGFRSLRVISRTSAMRYKGGRKTLPDIARELDVDAVLEGSVLRSGDRVRLSVQLIEASTDTHLWAGTFDRDLRDVLTLQDEFANAVAREISVTVTPSGDATPRPAQRLDPGAHEAYCRGRYLLEHETRDSLDKSFEYLQRAAALEPRFAPARVALAQWYFTAGIHGLIDPSEAQDKASEAAGKAIELDPALAAAHAQLAEVAFVQWRFDEAEQRFRQAVSVGPNDAWSIQRFGRFLTFVGKATESIDVMRAAQRLDPLSMGTVAGLGTALFCARRFQEAIAQFERALELERDSPRVLCQLGMVFALSDRFADAFSCLDQAAAVPDITEYGRSALTAGRIHTYARSGHREQAEDLIREFEAHATEPTHLSEAYAGLGCAEKVVEHLERALQAGGLKPLDAKCDPLYDTVRSTSVFQGFLARLGLPD
jgi:serine/threonine protein kinase/tetratricopeptide (TPR) repeat protein